MSVIHQVYSLHAQYSTYQNLQNCWSQIKCEIKYITQTLILYLAHCKMNFHFPIDNTNDTTERRKCQYPLTDRTP